MIEHLTAENFTQQVADGITLVDFWASWCRPCTMIAPIIEQIEAESNGKFKVAKVDVDAEQALAVQFGVMSIPTLMLFKDGAQVDKIVGVAPKNDILAMIGRHA